MSATTELLAERLEELDRLLTETADDERRQALIIERTRLATQLGRASIALSEGKQLLKG